MNVSWPASVQQELNQLIAGTQQHLSHNFVGMYLHGSLAMGGFNPASSDIDLLVVTNEQPAPQARHSLLALLMSVSGSPHPVEISFLRQSDLIPWQYPTPFELHYSEAWCNRFSAALAAGAWPEQPTIDRDLAAHVTLVRERGLVLAGKPISEVFSPVPREDYLDSMLSDLRWARERAKAGQGLVDAVLNSCRVIVYIQAGRVSSKVEGAEAALSGLPPEFGPLVRRSLAAYRGERLADEAGDRPAAGRLVDFVQAKAASDKPRGTG